MPSHLSDQEVELADGLTFTWCGLWVKRAVTLNAPYTCDHCRRRHVGRVLASDPAPLAVVIWADGSCYPNPGLGAYGTLLQFGAYEREMCQGYQRTTNNRMEMLGVIAGLEALKFPCKVLVYSDSRYVVDGVNKGWAQSWRANNWLKMDGKPARNPDLWGRLLDDLQLHDVTMKWVPGHRGVEGNERADRLAAQGRHGVLLVDIGF